MDAFDAEPLVAEILASPDTEKALAELHRVGQSSPAEGAAVLERLASSVAEAQPAQASRWLVEAAALWSVAAGDPKRASRALRAAIELSPGDEDALARLVQLYKDNDKHASLARILERRAETLAASAGRDPTALRRAADAFTTLGHVLRDEPLDSAAVAIAAYQRAIATGHASAETYRAARSLYLLEEQIADAIPLFGLERARTTDPEQIMALYREEAAARKLGGDRAGATEALRRALSTGKGEPGLPEEIARSILMRIEAPEPAPPVPVTECVEAAEIFATLAQASSGEQAWRAAERCFAAAERWEDASWAAERRGDYAQAIELLGRAKGAEPEDRIRLILHEARLCAVGLGDARRAATCYAALLGEVPPGSDAAMMERLLRADRGGTGSVVDLASKLEAAALHTDHIRGLKLAFELAVHALVGVARATELVRQAEVLAGLGAERHLALRHAEAGLEGLAPDEAGPLLERLSAHAGPDEAIDLYERHVSRCEAPDARAAAIALAARVALKRGSAERLGRFFDTIAGQCLDEPSLAALEKAAAEGDRKRGGAALRGLFAAALARAEPDVIDGGKTRSAFLRRAARVARRDLGDADQAFEWLGDALFARLEGALEDALAPLADHVEALRRTEAAARELRAVIEREQRARGGETPAPRPPTIPPPPPRAAGETPAPRPPTIPPPPPRAGSKPAPAPVVASAPPPTAAHAPLAALLAAPPSAPPPSTRLGRPPPSPPVPHFEARPASTPAPPPLELRDPFPAFAAAPAKASVPAPAPAPEVSYLPGPQRRLTGEELIADLFESMHAMDFCKDALEASAYTLTLAMDKLASAVGMAHLYDIDRREFVVVFARGPGAMAVRGLRTSDADPLAAEAMRTPGAVMLRDGDDPRAGGRRWELLRAVAETPIVSIACARVAQAGRFLGMIEVANLEGGGAFAEGDEHALAYIAERFTEYVAAHGVVLGEER